MAKHQILLVDDEAELVEGLKSILTLEIPEADIFTTTSSEEALDIIKSRTVDVMLTDIRMPKMDGMELLSRVLDINKTTTVIMMTGHGSIEIAINALKRGAYDFICKPFDYAVVVQSINKGIERTRLVRENLNLRRQISEYDKKTEFVGQSKSMQKFQASLRSVAQTDYNVFVRGENGTGKELTARTIHKLSKRNGKPFVVVNCPAIPEHLLESELFGHKRGAFTGATEDKLGLFEEADQGIICLDEIGDISVPVQAKLLRVLQEGEVRQLGSNQTRKVDVRVIAVTNQNLEKQIKENQFRQDLFYRLNVVTVWNPTLEEIKEDIPIITAHFLKQTCRELEMPEKRLSPEAMQGLMHRSWPGNIRELQNIIRQGVIFCPEEVIDASYFNSAVQQGISVNDADDFTDNSLAELSPYKIAKENTLKDFSLKYIGRLLSLTNGNVSRAANQSGLSRAALQKIINRFEINPKTYRQTV